MFRLAFKLSIPYFITNPHFVEIISAGIAILIPLHHGLDMKMTRLLPVITLFIYFSMIGAELKAADQNLYLSAGGKLSVFRVDSDSGKLKLLQEVNLPGAGPMTASPDKNFLYVCATQAAKTKGEKPQPILGTFIVKPDGRLEAIGFNPVKIRPGYLKTDAGGNFLAGSHYGPGKITIWYLDHGYYIGQTAQEVELEQKAHSAVFSPNNRFLLVPATGPNKVFQLRFDPTTGQAKLNDPPYAPGPRGNNEARQPRHLIFHPNKNIVYTTNEREQPGVGVWSWDPEKGALKSIQNIPTQPTNFDGIITTLNITTADLHLTPNQKFLYVSNRDVTDRKATSGKDSIVAFSVNPDNGRLDMTGHFPCEHVPRSFAIEENGRFLFVAGQGDNRLGTYRIDPITRALEKIGQQETGARPSWVHCMSPPTP